MRRRAAAPETVWPSRWPGEGPAVHVLHPGDVTVAFAGDRLETLLGSCVAVLMADRKRTTAAMCHVVHADRPGDRQVADTTFAYAALHEMFRRLRGCGLAPELCDTWLFGGGHMFPGNSEIVDVGGRNVYGIRALLRQHGIHPYAELVGGHHYRKVIWTVGPTPPERAVAELAVAAAPVAEAAEAA